MSPRLLLLVALALPLPQSTPNGGAIAKFVPPVPTPASFIADPRNVLGDSAHRSLDARIKAAQADSVGDIAVAIIPSIGDYSASQVAVEIYRTWRVGSRAAIGSARRDVGVLLLIAPKELSPNNKGECWITTGLGAEGLITDATAGDICRNSIIPHLRTRNYAAAVSSGIVVIENRLRSGTGAGRAAAAAGAGAAGAQAESTESTSRGNGAVAVVSGVGAAFLLLLSGLGYRRWRRYRPRKCPNCGQQMILLDELSDDAKLAAGQVVEEQVKSVNYDVWQCTCGETQLIPYKRFFTQYSKCIECERLTVKSTRRTIRAATRISAGEAEDRMVCKACGATWTKQVVLPRIQASSSGGSSGSGGGGGGGGGGSSFGGSGSTSGGGGGSSY